MCEFSEKWGFGAGQNVRREVRHIDVTSLMGQKNLLHRSFQLANVVWPVVSSQCLQCVTSPPSSLVAMSDGELLHDPVDVGPSIT